VSNTHSLILFHCTSTFHIPIFYLGQKFAVSVCVNICNCCMLLRFLIFLFFLFCYKHTNFCYQVKYKNYGMKFVGFTESRSTFRNCAEILQIVSRKWKYMCFVCFSCSWELGGFT
jgi:hypothetical protein